MNNQLGLVCDVCQNRIHTGHLYIPFIPGGYGQYKNQGFKERFSGHMHVSHLSSSDNLRISTKVKA